VIIVNNKLNIKKINCSLKMAWHELWTIFIIIIYNYYIFMTSCFEKKKIQATACG